MLRFTDCHIAKILARACPYLICNKTAKAAAEFSINLERLIEKLLECGHDWVIRGGSMRSRV